MTVIDMPRRADRGVWASAILLTLLIHGVVAAGLWAIRPFTPAPVQAEPPRPMEFVFAPEAEPAPKPDPGHSKLFTELPPDRADSAPEEADLLSNVNSRARGPESGASGDDLPRLSGSADVAHLAMTPGRSDSRPEPKPASPGKVEAPEKPKPAAEAPPEDAPDGRSPVVLKPKPEGPAATDPLAALERDRAPEPAPSEAPKEDPGKSDPDSLTPIDADRLKLLLPTAGADFFQEAMNHPEPGSVLPGGISLNTVAWPWAPWLQRFTRDFMRRWTAPYAYRMGLIHGSHTLELTIAPDGTLRRMEVVEKEGDDALVETSTLTFKAMAPFEPLPDDFPEKNLILRIRLVYPDLNQLRREVREARDAREAERSGSGRRRPGGRRP